MRRVPLWGIAAGVLIAIVIYIFVLITFFVDPFSFRWNAIYGEGVNPDGFEVRGIDVSRYQERIDWTTLRNANINGQPVRFAFIKATEGTDLIDPYFNENFYQARQNDILRGAYHFFSPRTNARQQARFFLRQVHLEAGDLPPVLDVETRGNLSRKELQAGVKKWLDVVEQHYGVKVRAMNLVVLHPSYPSYYVVQVPKMDEVVSQIIGVCKVKDLGHRLLVG